MITGVVSFTLAHGIKWVLDRLSDRTGGFFGYAEIAKVGWAGPMHPNLTAPSLLLVHVPTSWPLPKRFGHVPPKERSARPGVVAHR